MPLKWDHHFCYDHAGGAGSAHTRTDTYLRALPAVSNSLDFYSMKKELTALAARSAGTAVLNSLGTTSGGREVYCLQVGTDFETSKPAVLITGGIHAREWISPDFVYLLAEWIVDSAAAAVLEAQDLVATRHMYFVPMLNPDGHEYTVTTDRSFRKNSPPGDPDFRTSPTAAPSGPVAGAPESVDLNRHFDTAQWASITNYGGPAGDGQFSRTLTDDTYTGNPAESAFEAQMIRNFLNSTPLRLHLDVHSFGCMAAHSPGDDDTQATVLDPVAGPRLAAFAGESEAELDSRAAALPMIGPLANDWISMQAALLYQTLNARLRAPPFSLAGVPALTPAESRVPGAVMDASFYGSPAGANRCVGMVYELPPMFALSTLGGGGGRGSGFDLPESDIADVFRMCMNTVLALIKLADVAAPVAADFQQFRHLTPP